MAEHFAIGEGAVHIVDNKFEYLLLLGILLQGWVLDVGVDHDVVVLALAGETLLEVILISGQVFEEELPTYTPVFSLSNPIFTGMPSHANFLSLSMLTTSSLSRRLNTSMRLLEQLY